MGGASGQKEKTIILENIKTCAMHVIIDKIRL